MRLSTSSGGELMTWFRVDDGFYDHPKLKTIPRGAPRDGAVALWTLAGSWSMRYLTDGQVPAHQLDEWGAKPKSAEWLVAADLWHAAGHDCLRCPDVPAGHYLYHDWPGCQLTREEVEAEREAARKRQQVWRRRHGARKDDETA